MTETEPLLLRAARWCAFGSAVSVVFSIALCQIFLALALAALLLSGARLRLAKAWLPLGLFMVLTCISLLVSDNPRDGISQIRKFYVYLELLVVYSLLRDPRWLRGLVLVWAGIGALSGLRACVQFSQKVEQAQAAGVPFYTFYMKERISGFMSHWMTFSGQEMFVLLMLAAMLFFAPGVRRRVLAYTVLCATVIAVALLLGFTRSVVFLAIPGAMLYLLWFWKRWLILILPAMAAVVFLVSPAYVQQRFASVFRPRKDIDSNEFRRVTWRTGLVMVGQYPWFGLGPERVKARFQEFVPPDIPRPLPSGWYGHLHNIYLHYAAERGIPAMLVLMWFLGRVLYDFLRGIRRLPPGRNDFRFLLHGAVAVTIAVLLEGIFELNLGDSEVLTMFLVVVAAGYVALDPMAKTTQEEACTAGR